MKDIEEIGHSGGKININIQGTAIGFEISHSNPTACKISNLTTNIYGNQLPVFLISDSEGMFGYQCDECNKYFRASHYTHNQTTCCYCGVNSTYEFFLTKNQKLYIDKYIEKITFHIESLTSGVIDFDKIVDSIDDKSTFSYPDERQQVLFTCTSCGNKNDIIGKYAFCSSCGIRNTIDVYKSAIEVLYARVETPLFTKEQRELRENEWREVLNKSVSIFEPFANDILAITMSFYLHKKQRELLSRVSFQNIYNARATLLKVFQFDIYDSLSNSDIDFVNLMFQKRHLFTHCDGIVDQEFIEKSKTKSYRVGELVRLKSKEVKRFIVLLNKISENIWNNYNEFS